MNCLSSAFRNILWNEYGSSLSEPKSKGWYCIDVIQLKNMFKERHSHSSSAFRDRKRKARDVNFTNSFNECHPSPFLLHTLDQKNSGEFAVENEKQRFLKCSPGGYLKFNQRKCPNQEEISVPAWTLFHSGRSSTALCRQSILISHRDDIKHGLQADGVCATTTVSVQQKKWLFLKVLLCF